MTTRAMLTMLVLVACADPPSPSPSPSTSTPPSRSPSPSPSPSTSPSTSPACADVAPSAATLLAALHPDVRALFANASARVALAELDGAPPREVVLAASRTSDDGTLVGMLWTFRCDAGAYRVLAASEPDTYESDNGAGGDDGLTPAGFAVVESAHVLSGPRDAVRVEWIYGADHAWSRTFSLLALDDMRLSTLFACVTDDESHDTMTYTGAHRTIVIDDAALPARIRVHARWDWGPPIDDDDHADVPEGSHSASSVFTYAGASYVADGDDVCAMGPPEP